MNKFNYEDFFSRYCYSPSNVTLSEPIIDLDILREQILKATKQNFSSMEYCIDMYNRWFEINNLDLIIKPQQEVKAEENNSIEKLFNKL